MSPRTHLSLSPRPLIRRRRVVPRAGRLLTALMLSAGVSLAATAPASAGEYVVYACQAPDGQAAPLDGWNVDHSLPYSRGVVACGGEGVRLGLGFGLVPTNRPVSLRLKMPSGLRLTGATLDRSYWVRDGHPADLSASPTYMVQRDSGDFPGGALLEACFSVDGCRANGGQAPRVMHFAVPTDFLGIQAFCGGDPAGYCAPPAWDDVGRAEFVMRSAQLRVLDSDSPEARSVSGTLIDGDVKRGTETLSVEARDDGAGVFDIAVIVDGKEHLRRIVNTNGGRCAPAGLHPELLDFKYLRPCPAVAGAQLEVDTTKLPEGRPLVRVVVRDAAGNVATVVDRRVHVDNVPPPAAVARPVIHGEGIASGLRPGDRLTAVDGAWSGTGLAITRQWQRNNDGQWADINSATAAAYTVSRDDIGKQLRVVVRATNSEGTAEQFSDPTPAVGDGRSVQPSSYLDSPAPECVACNGTGGDTGSGQLVVDREQRSVQVRHGAAVVITGRLVDAANRPLAHAQLDVFQQLQLTAAPWTKIETITTDSQGGYAYRPKTTASRTIRFAYSAQRGGADYRATRDVSIGVKAKMTARAVRPVVKRGGLIRLKGRVGIDALPAHGAWVEVQVKDAGQWRAIATRRTSRTGLWKFNHRLKRSAGLTFQFRARLREAGDVAALATSSPTAKVRVKR